jgi:hypothetical protein
MSFIASIAAGNPRANHPTKESDEELMTGFNVQPSPYERDPRYHTCVDEETVA